MVNAPLRQGGAPFDGVHPGLGIVRPFIDPNKIGDNVQLC
jgi:hypothetical protein